MLRTENAPKTIYLKDYTAPDYTAESVDMTFKLYEGRTEVTTTTRYKRQNDNASVLFLNGQELKLLGLSIDDQDATEGADYDLDESSLTVKTDKAAFSLTTRCEIVPEDNTALEGLYKSGGNYTTQCESEGFRKITYFQDRPDVMSTYTVRIEADQKHYPILLCNGNLMEEGALAGGRHFSVWHDPFPKPSYLFALVAGDLVLTEDSFTTVSGRDVALKIYTRSGDEGQVAHAMQALKNSMKWDEEAYGREYDLDLFNIVAVSDFNMGAMENKSLNIFNTQLVLAHQETATDQDFLNVERVIGHEYFHNWSGNRVTCRDWFQLSLKEGFTVFRENQFGQAMNDPMVERIDEVKLVRSAQFPEDASPMAHPIRPESYIEINNFYTVTVYEKGGEVIRMLSLLLGDEAYRKATDLYFDRHDGQAATCDDFVQAMQDASGINLDQFKLWYSQAGTPRLTLKSEYIAEDKVLKVTLTQNIPDTNGQTNKKPMHIPIAVGLLDGQGQDMDLGGGETTRILHLTESEQEFTFDNIAEAPIVSALRGFSAPVILETDLSDDALRFLVVHDSDGFNRWDAGQNLALRMLGGMIKDTSQETDPLFIKALSGAIDALKGDDAALLARMLTLPEYSILAQQSTPIDPQAMKRARDKALTDIGGALKDQIVPLYEHAASQNDGLDTSAKAMGWRNLMNIALEYIAAADEALGVQLAQAQYEAAKNMSERIGALNILVNADDADAARGALGDFYDRFNDKELVVNKWFSIQASAEHKDVLAKVRDLMEHKDFTLKNPNRVRSLIAAFAMRNMIMFHDESGEGYRILREVVQELNTINPQIASRMLTPLRQWKAYKPELAELMRTELEAIKATPSLSPDVYEVVTKTLEA